MKSPTVTDRQGGADSRVRTRREWPPSPHADARAGGARGPDGRDAGVRRMACSQSHLGLSWYADPLTPGMTPAQAWQERRGVGTTTSGQWRVNRRADHDRRRGEFAAHELPTGIPQASAASAGPGFRGSPRPPDPGPAPGTAAPAARTSRARDFCAAGLVACVNGLHPPHSHRR